MVVRQGFKVMCNKCGKEQACVGTIEKMFNWYGEPVVRVAFAKPRWDECAHEVFRLSDLKVMERSGSEVV